MEAGITATGQIATGVHTEKETLPANYINSVKTKTSATEIQNGPGIEAGLGINGYEYSTVAILLLGAADRKRGSGRTVC